MKELYLVLKASNSFDEVFLQIKEALMGGVDKVQLVEPSLYSQAELALMIELCHNYKAKMIFHENLDYAIVNNADGVHFDKLPQDFNKNTLPTDFIVGLTVGNDEKNIATAVKSDIDYISFCSLYPSKSAINCELVEPDVVMNTASAYAIPIYVAGGIKAEHLDTISKWPITGIAMISEIIEADDITKHVEEIKKKLNNDAGETR